MRRWWLGNVVQSPCLLLASHHYDLGSIPGHMWDVFHASQPMPGFPFGVFSHALRAPKFYVICILTCLIRPQGLGQRCWVVLKHGFDFDFCHKPSYESATSVWYVLCREADQRGPEWLRDYLFHHLRPVHTHNIPRTWILNRKLDEEYSEDFGWQ